MAVLTKTEAGYVYGPNAPPRAQKAVHRVWWAVRRLSRDRWLRPAEVRRIGMAFARKCSGSPHRTFEAAVPALMRDAVGMLRGVAPMYGHEKGFHRLVEVASNETRFVNGCRRELELLKLIIEERANP